MSSVKIPKRSRLQLRVSSIEFWKVRLDPKSPFTAEGRWLGADRVTCNRRLGPTALRVTATAENPDGTRPRPKITLMRPDPTPKSNGTSINVSALAREYGVLRSTIRWRLANG